MNLFVWAFFLCCENFLLTKENCFIIFVENEGKVWTMIDLNKITTDQIEMIFVLLKIQNMDKRVCDLIPSYRTECFRDLKIQKFTANGIVKMISSSVTIIEFDKDYSENVLYCYSDCDTVRYITLEDILKHISFEDTV